MSEQQPTEGGRLTATSGKPVLPEEGTVELRATIQPGQVPCWDGSQWVPWVYSSGAWRPALPLPKEEQRQEEQEGQP
jgi:hypothetical protein